MDGDPLRHTKFKITDRYGVCRYTLGYKKIPFRTIWVQYPDIAPLCKKIGAAPTSVNPDGSPLYTLPVIHDPFTGKTISDSWNIAQYLDETYPDRPAVLPKGTRALQWSFTVAVSELAFVHIRPLLMYPSWAQLHPESQPFYRSPREAQFGCKLEEISAGAARAEHLESAEKSLRRVASWLGKNGDDAGFWIMGDTVSFADFFLGGWLAWVRRVDPDMWDRIKSWDNGVWWKHLNRLDRFAVFDSGQEYEG
jgi:glutathione S-transferase